MSTARAHAPALRLVNAERVFRAPALPDRHSAAASVRSENFAAASLAATDARWVLAVRASQSLEGGAAAILAPERRRRLISFALGMGLRAFDANLVIAIVQDAARCGLPPLGEITESRLTLVSNPRQRLSRPSRNAVELLAIAAGLGAVLFGLLLFWVRAGQP